MNLGNKIFKGTVEAAYIALIFGLLECSSGCGIVRKEVERSHHIIYDSVNLEKGFRVTAYDFNKNGIPEEIEQQKATEKGKHLELEHSFYDWDEDGMLDARRDKDGSIILYDSKSPYSSSLPDSLKDNSLGLKYCENFLLKSFKRKASEISPDSLENKFEDKNKNGN